MLKRKPRQPKPPRFPKPCQPRPTRFQPNYEKNERCSQRQYDWPCVQRKTPPTKADGVLLQTASLNHNKNAMQAVQKPLLGWAQENPTCARPTMGGGVLMLPPASLGVPPHSLVGVHKTSPNMTNKNHSKAHFFLARCACSQNNSFCEHCCLH